jgi:PAS domain S-box-containing protein
MNLLRQNQSELERLFLLSLEMLCIAGTDGYFKRVNPAFERTLGYDAGDLLSRPFIEFVHADDREATLAEIRKLSQGIATVHFTNRYYRKDGVYRWLRWTAVPQQREGLVYASASDITDQKRAEDWFRALLELAPDAIVIADSAGKIMLVNAQTENMFGYRREELLGQSVEILVPERLRQSHAVQRRRHMADPRVRGMGSRPDLPARRKDGSEFRAEIALSPIPTESGTAVFSVIRDVTERRRVEQALRDNEAQLLAARKIQQFFLPRSAPVVPGFDIAGASYAAEFTAGDHFDYIPMAGGTIDIVIGDVSGHGFGPALLMVALRNHLRALADHHDRIDEIFSDANRLLSGEMEDGYFVTLLMGRLDPRERTFHYLNAGHPSGYLLDAGGRKKACLESQVVPLGILPDTLFPTARCVAMEPGDLLLLVTDGILEAKRADGAMFAEKRMLDIARTHRHRSAAEIIDALHRAVLDFSDNGKMVDDATAVVLKAL